MKKYSFLIFVILLLAGLATAQNDTIYFMKSGQVILKHSIKKADVDSLIFYAPEELSSKVTDIDGNVYNTVRIGYQCWMAENLRVTHYRNGDTIPNVTNSSTWSGLTTGSWCVYNNSLSYKANCGLLYNWYAVNDSRKIAPEGWHVATYEDLTTMANYLIANGYNYDGTTEGNKIAKAIAATTSVWWNYSVTGTPGNNKTANNKSGLSIFPSGFRYNTGEYMVYGAHTNFLTSTEFDQNHARIYALYYDSEAFNFGSNGTKNHGFSVRCVKD